MLMEEATAAEISASGFSVQAVFNGTYGTVTGYVNHPEIGAKAEIYFKPEDGENGRVMRLSMTQSFFFVACEEATRGGYLLDLSAQEQRYQRKHGPTSSDASVRGTRASNSHLSDPELD